MTYNPLSQLYRTFPAIIDPDNTENSLASQIPKTLLFDILERLKALEANPGTGTTPGTGGAASWGSITGNLQNQTDLTNKLTTKADAATVTTELANKADKSTVTAALASKADTATVITDLATKADAATVNTELGKKADKTTVDASLAKKADTVTVNSALTAKADSMMVTTELAKKADKTVVDAALAKKADTADVNMQLDMLEDSIINQVDNKLSYKADKTTVDAALTTKADVATVTTELAKKADTVTVEAALATKANQTEISNELLGISNRVKTLEDNPTTGPGGDAVWGSITGDLQNQTDLKATLDTKADATTVNAELANKADNFTIDSNTLTMSDTRELSVKNVGGTNPNYSVITETYDLNAIPDGTQFLIVDPLNTSLVLNPPVLLDPTSIITIQANHFVFLNGDGFISQTVTISKSIGVDTYTRGTFHSPGHLTWGQWNKIIVKAENPYIVKQPDYIPLTSAEGSLFSQSDFIVDTQDDDYTEAIQIQSGFVKFHKPEQIYRLDPNDLLTKIYHATLNTYEFVMDLNVTTTGDPTKKSHDYVYKIPFSNELLYRFSMSFFWDYTSRVNMLGVASGNTISINIEATYDPETSVPTHYLVLTSHGGINPNDESHLTQLNFKLLYIAEYFKI